jgi:hypothetical protein
MEQNKSYIVFLVLAIYFVRSKEINHSLEFPPPLPTHQVIGQQVL